MPTVNVVNLKCGGCEASVKQALEKLGAKGVVVNAMEQTVKYASGKKKQLLAKLAQMGYPEVTSQEAKSWLKKGQSYVSCLIGKLATPQV